MELIIIFGPPAVGKMTVGMALEKKTGLKLFHNHLSIEFVNPFFSYGTETGRKLVSEFRRRIFEEVAASDSKGLIFTYVWGFDLPCDKAYIDSVCEMFKSKGSRISFVELSSDLNTRIERNKTELRLQHKTSKRDLAWSEQDVINTDKEHRTNTYNDFYYPDIHLKIDNTNLNPEETADKIIQRFQL